MLILHSSLYWRFVRFAVAVSRLLTSLIYEKTKYIPKENDFCFHLLLLWFWKKHHVIRGRNQRTWSDDVIRWRDQTTWSDDAMRPRNLQRTMQSRGVARYVLYSLVVNAESLNCGRMTTSSHQVIGSSDPTTWSDKISLCKHVFYMENKYTFNERSNLGCNRNQRRFLV